MKDREGWKTNDIIAFFGTTARSTLHKAESEGRIPKAERHDRNIRIWNTSSIPEIGKLYGFLKRPDNFKPKTICIYTAKGGVLKTTSCYTISRLLSLNGYKTIMIGLDPQLSLTQLALSPLLSNLTLDKLPIHHHIGEHIFFEDGKDKPLPLDNIIQHTDIPTLDLIPETASLAELIGTIELMHYTRLKKKPDTHIWDFFKNSGFEAELKKKYDFIIYDCGPTWTALSQNALYTSDFVISPNACEPGAFQVLQKNLEEMFDFEDESNKKWEDVFIVPTLKDHTKLSNQIHGWLLQYYPDYVTKSYIRRSVTGSESFAYGFTPCESLPKSDLAEDYFSLMKEIWKKLWGEK